MAGRRCFLGSLFGLTALLLAGCLGKPVTVEIVKKKNPVRIETRNALAPIQLDRVVVKLRRGTIIGSYVYNPFECVPRSGNIVWSAGRKMFRDLELQDAFFNQMTAANFNITGDPDEMFGDSTRRGVIPEYLVGAQLEDIRLNVCDQKNFLNGWATGSQSGASSVRVTWQVFSKFEERVVYETESRGSAKLESATPEGMMILIQDAFADAVANLAADKKFVSLLREKPRTVADVRKVDDVELVLSAVPQFDDPITGKIDLIRHAVVTIENGSGHGSGFFIAPTLVLTNHHVVAKADLLRIQLITGRKILGEVVRRHPERDVALVQVEAAGHRPLPLRFEPVKITEEVFAIGAPLDPSSSGTVTKGIVSRFTTNDYGLEDIQADVDIQGGDSGGALLDARGNVVGITYAGVGEYSVGMNFFIPIYDALDKLNVSVDSTRGSVVAD